MTPDEFKAARKALGLKNRELAAMLDISPERAKQTFYDWTSGLRQMDGARARLLRAYLDGHRPDDWPGK